MSATAYPALKSSDAWPPFREQTWVDWQQPQVAGQEGPETYSRVKEPSCLQRKGPIPDGPEMQPLSFLLQPQLSEGGPQDCQLCLHGVKALTSRSLLPPLPSQRCLLRGPKQRGSRGPGHSKAGMCQAALPAFPWKSLLSLGHGRHTCDLPGPHLLAAGVSLV